MTSGEELTASEARNALAEFGQMLQDRFAYSHANQYDYESALVALSSKVTGSIGLNELGSNLHRIVAGFIDGHAWVEPYRLAEGCLPVRLEPLGKRVVAVKANRSGFVAKEYPFLTSIDHRPLEDWFLAVRQVIPIGTEAYTQRRSLLQLEHIQHWRAVLDLPLSNTVRLGLSDEGGSRTTAVEVSVRPEPLPISRWPDTGSRILEGNIGYLRLKKMDDAAVTEIQTWMPQLLDTTALIIDVRDNTGGLRSPLVELWPWLEAPGDAATVGSVGAYRLWSGFPPDHLSARYMFRADDRRFSEAQRDAIGRFASNFIPEADLRDEGFSEWHYLVLPQPQVSTAQSGRAFYQKPVLILVNEKCFSAVDIFLGALGQLENVRLMGRPSSGGSAFGMRHSLADGAITTRLGSMISFRPDGMLYDTRGFEPEIPHMPEPEDFILGGGDSTLAAALRFIHAV